MSFMEYVHKVTGEVLSQNNVGVAEGGDAAGLAIGVGEETAADVLIGAQEVADPNRKWVRPGEIQVCRAPVKLFTLVGSSVTLCLWERHRKIGGMNHFILPHGAQDAQHKYRYASHANAALLERIIRAGANINFVVARIFGGRASGLAGNRPEISLGGRNLATTLDFLWSTGIPLVQKDVGGRQARKLAFDLATGAVESELL